VQGDTKAQVQYDHQNGLASAMGSITSRMSRMFRIGHHDHQQPVNGEAGLHRPRVDSVSSGSSRSSSSSQPSMAPTPMLDPSTNANPLEPPDGMNDKRSRAGEEEKKKKKKRTGDVSKHTFYVENSQMRLKLFARNEVRSLHSILTKNSGLIRSTHSVRCCNGSLHSRKSLRVHTTRVAIGSIALLQSG
jgi:phospholipase D1/2